jgi:hypothetical protein
MIFAWFRGNATGLIRIRMNRAGERISRRLLQGVFDPNPGKV